jgi:hypothetical protein
MAPPSINTQVLIDSSNKWLDVWDAVGGNQQVSIAEQTYADIPEVCAALQVVLQALGGTWAAATVTVVFDGAVPGMVRIHSNQAVNACTLRWLNGPHGSGALDTHIGTVLGFDDAADDNGAFFYTSDWQHTDGWYAIRAIRSYGPPLPNHVGGEFRKVLSQKYAKILTVGWEYTYDFVLESIDPWHMLWTKCVGANTNRAFDYVFEKMIKGEWFRVREDQEVLGTFLNCYLAEPRRHQDNVVRAFPDYEVYNLSLRFTGRIL